MIEIVPTDIAHGGEAVGRVDGKAHFVAGAMPGERVRGELERSKKTWARVRLREIVEASPERVEPPCPHFADCGGCQWQFAEYAAQLRWKESILSGQLAHLGRIENPPVGPTVAVGPAYGYRTRMDFAVHHGSPALHRRRSDRVVPLDTCLLLHPGLLDVFERLGDLDGATTVTLRIAVATGERVAVVTGAVPEGADDWGCAVVLAVGDERHEVVGRASITEVIAGVPLRITADAFFQNSSTGAEVLAGLVAGAIEAGPDDVVLDAYAGGGLFAATAARGAGRIIAIESDALALADLRHNLAGSDVRIVDGRVEEAGRTIDERWDTAIVDPPRSGLGAAGVTAIVGGEPETIAYVSCDPAALARDARMLLDAGYALERVTPVDLFPQTYHVEAVAVFRRSTG